mmetsp:Transcript_33204/g.93069  ORF Transcript_33204/g.93069 Transcript_33204/m.93069 type:complete len:125 (+) Transcript_33204:189-563(+)
MKEKLLRCGAPIQGKPVSGRSWKRKRERHSAIDRKGTPVIRKSWKKRQQEMSEWRDMKEKESGLRKRKREETEARREASKRKREQKQQNELKSMQFQVISDTKKINKMSKKQRKLLVKMDTSHL